MAYKILVVEDEATMRRLMTLLLKRKGHELLEADNGEQAVEIARSQRPDIILLDIMMPGMDGFETLRRLRAIPETGSIPVIFLSAKSQVEDRVEGLRLGADDYVIKPADPEELAARIDAVMTRTQRSTTRQRGRVIGFLGVKGGVGTTTVVANLGAHFSQESYATLLVDLHLAFGNLADHFGLKVSRTTVDLASLQPERIGIDAIERTRLSHASGVAVLASPTSVFPNVTYTADHLAAILEQAAFTAQMVLVDLPVDPDIVAAVASKLDGLVLVTGSEPATLRAADGLLAYLKSLQLEDKMSVILLNRAPAAKGQNQNPVDERFDRPLLGAILPQPELYLQAEAQMMPLVLAKLNTPDRSLYAQIGERLLSYEEEMSRFQKNQLLQSRRLT